MEVLRTFYRLHMVPINLESEDVMSLDCDSYHVILSIAAAFNPDFMRDCSIEHVQVFKCGMTSTTRMYTETAVEVVRRELENIVQGDCI